MENQLVKTLLPQIHQYGDVEKTVQFPLCCLPHRFDPLLERKMVPDQINQLHGVAVTIEQSI